MHGLSVHLGFGWLEVGKALVERIQQMLHESNEFGQAPCFNPSLQSGGFLLFKLIR
jgi:hypothetical protein